MQITSTMMSLNVHIEFQKWKVFLIRDNYATHSLQHVGRGEAFGFVNLKFSNITIFFLPPNLVQPLHQGIIDPFKILYKKKLLEWVLSEFDFSNSHHDLRKIVPNVRQT